MGAPSGLLLAAVALVPAGALAVPAEVPLPPLVETPEQHNARMQWWRDAKFGLFIHWGPVSLTGGELSWCRKGPERRGDHQNVLPPQVPAEEYDQLYKRFNPTKFDARQWVKIAQDAGMKYLVMVCKHHDGFSMFHTKLSDYNIANTPFQRDVVKELADACHAAGLKFGVYYSTRDWYHPDYLVGDNSKYNDFYEGQVRELLSNYGKVDIMWFDHVGGNWGDYRFRELFEIIYGLQPAILVNDRAARFVHATKDQPTEEIRKLTAGDYYTPEQTIGRMDTDRDWESCMCLVGRQWSYLPNGELDSLQTCVRNLVSCASGGGNLLLDVGPMPTGEIEPRQAARLKEVGDWLRKYGRSVYGTRGGPFTNGRWGGSTHQGNKVYLHVFEWPGDTLRLAPLKERVVAARLLAGGEVKLTQSDRGIDITVPAERHDPIDTVIELTLERPATEILRGPALRSLLEDPAFGTIISADATFTASSTSQWDPKEQHGRLLAGAALPGRPACYRKLETNPPQPAPLALLRVEVYGK